MKGHSRFWIAMAGAATLVTGHAVILYCASSDLALSTAVVTVMIGLVIVKHLGLPGWCLAILRKPWRRSANPLPGGHGPMPDAEPRA